VSVTWHTERRVAFKFFLSKIRSNCYGFHFINAEIISCLSRKVNIGKSVGKSRFWSNYLCDDITIESYKLRSVNWFFYFLMIVLWHQEYSCMNVFPPLMWTLELLGILCKSCLLVVGHTFLLKTTDPLTLMAISQRVFCCCFWEGF